MNPTCIRCDALIWGDGYLCDKCIRQLQLEREERRAPTSLLLDRFFYAGNVPPNQCPVAWREREGAAICKYNKNHDGPHSWNDLYQRAYPEPIPELYKNSGPASEAVNHPAHYGGDTPHETIKCLEAWGLESDALLWNAVKYIARAGKKGPIKQDLEKALWYLKRRIEILTSDTSERAKNASAIK